MAVAYYNEHDPFAAAWLRNLIAAGHIAPGDVDERDIRDVVPTELVRYTQCHFFAGIGVWSLALRLAGWDDSRPVWTGSCPCQPFSAAGKREGLDDERHLWPAWHHLIRFNRPDTILGEQVASPDGLGWLDLVYSDLEGEGYTCGALDLCAAGVGAPHIRQRLWFVGMADTDGCNGKLSAWERTRSSNTEGWRAPGWAAGHSDAVRLADTARSGSGAGLCHREPGEQRRDQLADGERVVGLVDSIGAGLEGHGRGLASSSGRIGEVRSAPEAGEPCGLADSGRPGPLNGFWRDADWLFCRDGRWRPARSGPQQMVDGSADCMGRLRPGEIAEIQEEVNDWSQRHNRDAGEALRDLWRRLSAEALREREAGRSWCLFEAPILLAFLRQLTEQGWQFSDPLSCSCAPSSQVVLRSLRLDSKTSRSSCGRELEEQQSDQSPDALRELSSVLARAAESAWGETCRAYAGRGFPLVTGAKSRVGRLRAYGNAISPWPAKEFIEAVMKEMP